MKVKFHINIIDKICLVFSFKVITFDTRSRG